MTAAVLIADIAVRRETTLAVAADRMLRLALGVFAAAAVSVALPGSPEQSLAYACGLFAFVLIPGAALASGRLA